MLEYSARIISQDTSETVVASPHFLEALDSKFKPVWQELEETNGLAIRGCQMADQNLQELDIARTDLDGKINNLYDVTHGIEGDLKGAKDDAATALNRAGSAESAAVAVREQLGSMDGRVTNADGYIDNAFAYISNIIHYQESSREYTITSSGRVSSRVAKSCSNIQKDLLPTRQLVCQPPIAEPEIRLVLYSDFESLRSQVAILTSKLAQLEARTTVTPVTNSYNRAKKGTLGQVSDSIYPLYGDWLLTSDAKEQKIYFSGLRAEIGRSIYIQTRKKAYLNANGHSFFGLPSVSENQWLSNNTTYRFLRAGATSWVVTSSPSPYPWT